MDKLTPVVLYISFYSMIGFAIYWSNSLLPLWALLATPTYKHKDDNDA